MKGALWLAGKASLTFPDICGMALVRAAKWYWLSDLLSASFCEARQLMTFRDAKTSKKLSAAVA